MTPAFGAQDALLATMILTAAADGEIKPSENNAIAETARRLPAFEGFNEARLGDMTAVIVEVLREEDGIDQGMRLIREALPAHLRETAYALACEIAAADGQLAVEEVRLLELIRHGLRIDRLAAAAIERGARARYARL